MESMAKISSKLESIQEQLDAEDLNTTIANIKEQMTTLERNIEAETKALVLLISLPNIILIKHLTIYKRYVMH
jgi:small-conductance mechanosensitive channel